MTGSPVAGLPYRLVVSDSATPARPHRLLVWLHPTGTDGLALVEPWGDELARHGWALLTLPRERVEGWSGAEANRLMLGVVPDVARVPGVDARRPVLLGFSAGAQMALELGAARPDVVGGLALVAGSPRISRADERTPPVGLATARVPLVSWIGALDGSAPLWREAREPWLAAGLLLELREVPGQGHAWLLADPAVRAALLAWLDDLPRN
ncbi:hypothetical protein JGU66_06980 [Myxococcaceae bacterium JPH2]|nr:hypothetical protein [Myxococcaceae bacterium JPH2]